MNAEIGRSGPSSEVGSGTHEVLGLLLETSKAIAAEVELEKVVQKITDVATELCGAAYGAFFYNTKGEGRRYALCSLAGIDKELFAGFPMPHETGLFKRTFQNLETVRLHDVSKEPEYGKKPPYHGMPPGHPPVKSYMAVPVVSRTSKKVIGSLFFGHSEPGVFDSNSQKLAEGIAAQGAIAMENARLFEEKKKITANMMAKTRQLQYVNEDLRNFTYTISHDLKNPLSVVLAYSSMAEEFNTIGDLREALNHVHRNSQKISDILEGLVKVIQAEGVSEKIEMVRLDELLLSIQEELEDEIRESRCRISADFKLEQLVFTRSYLESILRNLISNSIKYQFSGRIPEIKLTSYQEGSKAVFVCSDNGMGIDLERHGRNLFQPFKRFTDSKPGTGIGLFMIRRLIEKYGGSINIKSKVGEGTTCVFDLPVL